MDRWINQRSVKTSHRIQNVAVGIQWVADKPLTAGPTPVENEMQALRVGLVGAWTGRDWPKGQQVQSRGGGGGGGAGELGGYLAQK